MGRPAAHGAAGQLRESSQFPAGVLMPWTTQRAAPAALRLGRSYTNFVRGARCSPCCSSAKNIPSVSCLTRRTWHRDRVCRGRAWVPHLLLRRLRADSGEGGLASVPPASQEGSASAPWGPDSCPQALQQVGVFAPGPALSPCRPTVGQLHLPVAGHHACFPCIGLLELAGTPVP